MIILKAVKLNYAYEDLFTKFKEFIMKQILVLTFLTLISNVGFGATKVAFTKPHDGEIVPATFPVEFSVEGMKVEKAGAMKEGTGHHHLIIDAKAVAKGQVIPKDETHKHFGDGSSSTTLTLKPGKHTLTLQFADGAHKSYGEDYSASITVEVK